MSARKTVDKLIEHGWTVSFAESCTGGLAAGRIVDIPDASKVINASVVTYSNEAKTKYASVNPETIDRYTVVSEEVAIEMARGIAKNNDAEVGVGITGVAGPTGGTPECPVGTVCFGFYIDGKEKTSTMHFGEIGRNEVRAKCVDYVMETLCELL